MDQGMIDEELRIAMEREGGRRVVLDKVVLGWPVHRLKPRQPPLSIEVGLPVAEAIDIMTGHAVGAILVMEGPDLVGIVTERDIVRKVAAVGGNPEAMRVEEIMTSNPERLRISDPLIYALNKMVVGGFRHLPLVDDAGTPVATLSMRHILRFLVDYFAQEAFTVPPTPGKNLSPAREGA